MDDQTTIPFNSNPLPTAPSQPPMQPNHGILNMTLGQLMQNNPTAQNMVMKGMNISPQQFQQMLNMTGNNQMMNQTIGDLFKNGTMTQAMQVNPQQFQQMLGGINMPNPQGQFPNGQAIPVQQIIVGQVNPAFQNMPTLPLEQPKPTLFQKIINLFK